MELTNDERLALMVAIDKKLNDKNGGMLVDAKNEARSRLLDSFEKEGNDRKAIMVCNVKVGEVGITFSKPKPAIKTECKKDALEFLLDNDLAEIVPKRGWEEHFSNSGGSIICNDTGEIVDWALWEDGYAKTAAVRGCKPQDVLDALKPKLGGTSPFAILMEG